MPNRIMMSVHATPDVSGIRTATLFNEEHTIIPCIALVEGVLWAANSPAPELALAEEFGRFPDGWNGRPVVYDHPFVDGLAVSASSPSVMEGVAFGQLFNTSLKDKKLKTEIWINNARVERMSDDIKDAVTRLKEGDETVEVSTGLFTMSEETSGEFNGEVFEAIWRNVVPDHLAVLPPGVKGACSVEDGCGAPRSNQMKPAMRAARMSTTPTTDTMVTINAEDCGCTDTTKQGMFQKIMGAVSAAMGVNTPADTLDESADTDDIVDVNVIDNAETQDGSIQENSMNEKDQLVNDLVANATTSFTEDDRAWLSTLEESQLAKLSPVINEEVEALEEVEEVVVEDPTSPEAPETLKAVSTEEYIAAAPDEVRDVLNEGLKMHRNRKESLIKSLMDNARNTFSKEQLNAKSVPELEAIASLATDITFEGAAPIVSRNSVDNDAPPAPIALFDLNAGRSA